MNRHLGAQAAALVDGQLDYAAREKALRHLEQCAQCRAEVEHERRLKARVQTLPGGEPSASLLTALTRVPADAPPVVPEPPRHWPTPGGKAGQGGLVLAGVGSVAAGVLSLAYVVGGATAAAPDPVAPPVGRFSTEFVGSEQPVPLRDPAVDAFTVIGNPGPAGGR